MARVDYEQAWLELRRYLVAPDEGTGRARQGIGIDRLLARMGRIEAECGFEEGHLERTLRRYGVVFSDDLRTSGAEPAPPERHGATGDGDEPAPSGGGHETAPKEATRWPDRPTRTSPRRAPTHSTP